jgi:hypothetical protein
MAPPVRNSRYTIAKLYNSVCLRILSTNRFCLEIFIFKFLYQLCFQYLRNMVG